MMRAHQFFSFGVNISKGGKVITLFTSSNYCDQVSCAGCALVGTDDRVQLIMKEHSVRTAKKPEGRSDGSSGDAGADDNSEKEHARQRPSPKTRRSPSPSSSYNQ